MGDGIAATVGDLIDELATASDEDISRVRAKLVQAVRLAAGDDRAAVVQAIQACDRLMRPPGVIERAIRRPGP